MNIVFLVVDMVLLFNLVLNMKGRCLMIKWLFNLWLSIYEVIMLWLFRVGMLMEEVVDELNILIKSFYWM